MAARYRIVITKGDPLRWGFTYRAGKPSAPVNLTGYTGRFQAREKAGAPGAPLLELTTENGGMVLGGAAGTVEVLFPATVGDQGWEHAEFGVELVQPDGTPIKLLKGNLAIVVELPHD